MMTLPKSMSRLVNLQRLDIGNNDFTELPEVVGDLINLTELWIDGNDIRRIPANIEQLYHLNHFDCTMNSIHEIPSEIQGWRDISIMNLSSNEIYELPDTMCFLHTIVTLKIDDNQLNSLPNDIGQMSSLEELIVTKNFLEYLPSSVGNLRKLHCLNVDNNYLRCLPPEIGNCTALSLLSVRSNNLTQVPPELGLLSSLRVLNLVNNCIKFLPMSMLNLSNLKALWLSDNQSQPLVPLQQEFNHEENMMILSCFMLPQKSRQDLEQMVPPIGPISTSVIGTGRRICFAAEVESEVPRQFHRAPTPYPKELRNLARHARNLHHQSTHDQRNPYASLAHIDAQTTKEHKNNSSVIHETEHCNSEESSDEANKIVLAKEKSPDIREAKCIRNPTSEFLMKGPVDYVNSTWRPDEYSKANVAKIVESEKFTVPYRNTSSSVDDRYQNQISVHTSKPSDVPPIPPPYHIAAAFSKKAAFFQQLNHAPQLDHHTTNTSHTTSSISNHDEKSLSNHVQKSKIKDCIDSFDKNITSSERKTVNASPDNEKKKSSTDASEETCLPTVENADSELTFESDRSLKPSKIPILKTKHLEGSSCPSTKNVSPSKYINSTIEDNQPPQSILSIPTSPVTGKKYRSPLSMHSKFFDRPKKLVNGTVSNNFIPCDNSNTFDVTDSGIAMNPKADKENVDVTMSNTDASRHMKDGVDIRNETISGKNIKESIDIRNETNSGRSTPLLTDAKLPINLNNFDTKNSKTPAVSELSTPERKPKLKWMFGPHKNANVLPVQVKKNPGLGFSIAGGVTGAGTGIIVTKVNPDGPAQGTLRPGDKILEVDGIDFTKSDHDNAVAVLRATGAVVSMMISRHQ